MQRSYEPYAPLFLRLGLGLVFFAKGLERFVQGELGTPIIPTFFTQYLPVTAKTLIYAEGIIAVILGIFLILGFYTKVCAGITAGILVIMIIQAPIMLQVQEAVALGTAISLWITGGKSLSLDRLREEGPQNKKKHEKDFILGEDSIF